MANRESFSGLEIAKQQGQLLERMADSLGLRRVGGEWCFQAGKDRDKTTFKFVPSAITGGTVKIESPFLCEVHSSFPTTTSDWVEKLSKALDRRVSRISFARARWRALTQMGECVPAVILDPEPLLFKGNKVDDMCLVISPELGQQCGVTWHYFLVCKDEIAKDIGLTDCSKGLVFYRENRA